MTDRFLASDPGLVRLTIATRAAVSLAIVLGVEALVASALGLSSTIVPMIGAVHAMIGTFSVSDPTARGRLTTLLCLPVAMFAALALATTVDRHRVLSLVTFVVIMFVVVWVRRFGPRAFACGMVVWIGFFFSLFLQLHASALPMVAVALAVSTVVLLLLMMVVAPARPARRLRRMTGSFAARVRIAHAERLAREAAGPPGLDALDARALLRVDEAAVLVDGQLALPGALADPTAAPLVRAAVLEVEAELADRDPHPLEALERLETVLAADRARDPGTLDRLATTLRARRGAFTPAADLFAGFLPGSVPTVTVMLGAPGPANENGTGLRLTTRHALQVALAAGLAIALGDLVSGQRWYWAVLACFLSFTGTATAAETVTKAAQRTVGTVAGVVTALLLVPWAGHGGVVVIAIILVAIFLGFYLFRVSYTALAFFVTLVVAELYEMLGTFSGGLLALRVAETALGAVIGALVAIAFLPAPARRAEVAARDALAEAVRAALDEVAVVLGGHPHEPGDTDLHARARALDAALHQLALVGVPLTRRSTPVRRADGDAVSDRLRAWTLCAVHVRAVVRAVERHREHRPSTRFADEVHEAAAAVRGLADALGADGGARPASSRPAPSRPAPGDRSGPGDAGHALDGLHGALVALHEIESSGTEGSARPVAVDGPAAPSATNGSALPSATNGSAAPSATNGSVAPVASDDLAPVRLSGRVTDAEGAAVDAVVTLVDGGGRQRGLARTESGRYALGLSTGSGTWQLVTTGPPGHAPHVDRLVVGPGRREIVHDVVLAPVRRAAPRAEWSAGAVGP